MEKIRTAKAFKLRAVIENALICCFKNKSCLNFLPPLHQLQVFKEGSLWYPELKAIVVNLNCKNLWNSTALTIFGTLYN